ncbi:MAG TPA: UDP-N-acetylmuramoyl-tripeptide--D-alanyl-D-alanine ligase [Gemmatimonadales bacterium]
MKSETPTPAAPPEPWTAAQVSDALGVKVTASGPFIGVSTDTRSLTPGALFLALAGERFDAHAFLDQARAGGAGAAVVRRGTPGIEGLPFIEVPDTLVALGALARARRRRLADGSPVVAVTGSSGKTSTKELIRAALGVRYHVHATAGNLNNLVGVPLSILAAPAGTDAMVIEAGANLPGEIPRLRDIIEPTIAVVTNVGYAHVEGFGSLEGVMREKVSLVEKADVAVVGTDPPGLAVAARAKTRTVVAGAGAGTDMHPDAADLDESGHPRIRWGGREVTVPVTGFHQIDNAAIAVAVAREAGIRPGDALQGLTAARVPGGRGAVTEVRGLTVIDDSYNANPGSLRRAVEFARWLADRRSRPLAVVVGTMLELGAESDKLHRAAAEEIVAAAPALVGAVGAFEAAFSPFAAALKDRLVVAPDAERLGPLLKQRLMGNEVVLLKASRGVALERVLRHLN